MDSLPIDQTLDYTYHEKMEIITRWHCEPLRTKGYRIRENAVCENNAQTTVKSKQNNRISTKTAK